MGREREKEPTKPLTTIMASQLTPVILVVWLLAWQMTALFRSYEDPIRPATQGLKGGNSGIFGWGKAGERAPVDRIVLLT